jgi:Kef-type K+ transport system membrane component KefB
MIEHLETLVIGFLLGASSTVLVYAVARDLREMAKPVRTRKLRRRRVISDSVS